MAKVLCVDDDTSHLLSLRRILERGGHQVVTTTDLDEVNLLLEHGFEIVLLDTVSLDGKGWNLLRELSEEPRTRHTPILVVSAAAEVAQRIRALKQGAYDYMVKPVDPEELLARVETVTDRNARSFRGLQGSIENNPVLELIQHLWQGTKTGSLEIVSAGKNGSVDLSRGSMVSAAFGRFSGREALVAMCELRKGIFRFLPEEESPDDGRAAAKRLPLQNVLMEVAWLKDELLRRPDKLPDQSQGLRFVNDVPEVPKNLEKLPIVEVAARVGAQPGICLTELFAIELAAPLKIRLSVAWLAEQGVLELQGSPIGTRAAS